MSTLAASSSLAADEAALPMQRSRGYWASAALRFTRDPVAVGAALVVLLLIALAVMGLQLGYLLGGSILIETVFSWPGTGFLLNSAIFQRDLPLLQGTILVLALFFVVLNLLVDVLQTLLDPRIARA